MTGVHSIMMEKSALAGEGCTTVHVYLYVLCGFNSQTVKLIINRNLRCQYLSEFRLLLPYVGLCVAVLLNRQETSKPNGKKLNV
jgi:hypothetical protein